MKAEKGYYSLIQFCPNASRMETVNVGVVLFCPESGFLDARTTGNNRRAKGLAGADNFDRYSLNAAKLSIEKRLVVEKNSFDSLEDIQKFVETRGNDLRITPPRPLKVFSPEQEMNRLFDELVGGRQLRDEMVANDAPAFGEVKETFNRLIREERAHRNYKLALPFGGEFTAPYAYQNGVLNLVKPQPFPKSEKAAIKTAMQLAVQGDQIHKEPIKDIGKAQLVVVSEFAEHSESSTSQQVNKLFRDYHVKHVENNRVAAFLKQVEQEAHA